LATWGVPRVADLCQVRDGIGEGSRFCRSWGSPVPIATAPGVVTARTFLPAAIAGIVLGHLSLAEIRKSVGRVQVLGLAMAGLVLESMRLATIPFLIIAAIAITSFLRAHVAANESAALHGQVTHPASGYTCSLSDLTDLIGPEFLVGGHGGYVFPLTGCAPDPPGATKGK
jgi:hypothetical protein